MINDTQNTEPQRHHNRGDRYLGLRNVLNLLFMIGAIIGVIVYFTGSETTYVIIILVAMLFKIVECVLRFIK